LHINKIFDCKDKNSTGLSGEYYVSAELLRRGFNVGITMGNAKSIDILAEKDNKQFIIHVKAIDKRKNIGWPLMKDKINLNHYYIFVILMEIKWNLQIFILLQVKKHMINANSIQREAS
jgi:hypothetical protein